MHDYRYDAAFAAAPADRPGLRGHYRTLGESWITGGAAGSQRATLTGLYASAFTGCQLAGPLLISVGPAWQTSALIAIVAVTAVCLLMLRHLPTGTRESLGERASWRSLGAFLPVLASGVFCFAFFDASILALLPLYGMDKGLNEGAGGAAGHRGADRRCDVPDPARLAGRPGRDSPRASELRGGFQPVAAGPAADARLRAFS